MNFNDILISHFSNHRLFDGDETVALVADKAAEIAGRAHTDPEVKKSSSEMVKLELE